MRGLEECLDTLRGILQRQHAIHVKRGDMDKAAAIVPWLTATEHHFRKAASLPPHHRKTKREKPEERNAKNTEKRKREKKKNPPAPHVGGFKNQTSLPF